LREESNEFYYFVQTTNFINERILTSWPNQQSCQWKEWNWTFEILGLWGKQHLLV